MSSSLCPHLFRIYLTKSSEILETYKPQIINFLNYSFISKKLRKKGLISFKEHRKIINSSSSHSNTYKMEALVEILKQRMWGLEQLISILTEEDIENWLSENLFQAYTRYLIGSIKKLEGKKFCDCLETGNPTLLRCSWFVLLEKLDSWLLTVGNSLGILGKTVHPMIALLEVIRERLDLKTRVQTLSSMAKFSAAEEDTGTDSDSVTEHEDDTRLGAGICLQSSNCSYNPSKTCSTMSLRDENISKYLEPEKPLEDSIRRFLDDSFERDSVISELSTTAYDDEADIDDDSEIFPTSPGTSRNRRETIDCADFEWDELKTVEDDSQFYTKLSLDTEFILDYIESTTNKNKSVNERSKSKRKLLPSSASNISIPWNSSTKFSGGGGASILQSTENPCSSKMSVHSLPVSVDTTSVSTQTMKSQHPFSS